MAEKVMKLGIARNKDFMLYVKDGDVWQIRRKQPGAPKGMPEKVAEGGFEMDNDFIYFVDRDGDVSRAKRADTESGGKKRMTTFIDGYTTVSEAREADVEDAISRVTGLTIPTIRAKLRDAHGATKLRNLFRQWPERTVEVGRWTANFALQCQVFDEISQIASVGPRVAKRLLEEAHGKTLVQNVFADTWPQEDGGSNGPRGVDRLEEDPKPQAPPRNHAFSDMPDDTSVAPPTSAMDNVREDGEGQIRSSMFRRYDLEKARATRARREPAPHQAEALVKLQDWYRSRPSKERGGILALPTGGGKTFTTVRFLCQEPLSDGYKVLWLAHTHHLLEQAIDAFGPVDGGASTPLEVAHIAETRAQLDVRVVSATPGHFPLSKVSSADDVVIATLQTIVAAHHRGHEKLKAFLDSSDGKLVVIFDEAHHAPAPSYCTLVERLRADHPGLYLLGLTATPTYSDERRQGWLKKLFPQDVLHSVSRSRLIAMGVLSRPHFENRRTDVTVELEDKDYQRWLSSYSDLPEHIVTKLAENRQRNDLIADTYADGREKYGKTLMFADRWHQCDYLREALAKRNVRADVVYSHVDARLPTADERNKRSKDENSRVLQRFRNGELDVIINVKMLTEGTDVPSVQTVFLTRQTTSGILLTQMIGRALRGPKFGGTENAYIVSFIDNWKQVISFADYETLPVGQADDAVPEYGKRPPLQLISIELVRRLARQMYRGGGVTAPFVTLLPVGWYRVEYQTCSGEGDDSIWQRHLVMVFDNEKGRYDAFVDALGEEDLTAYAAENLSWDEARPKLQVLRERYFAESDDHPGAELLVDLFRIARHMGQSSGDRPIFFKFEERLSHDIDAIARECVDADLGVRALEDRLLAEYVRVDRFWRSLYSNYGVFNTQYQAAQRRILDAMRLGVEPERYVGVVETPEVLPLREPSEAIREAVFNRDGRRCCCCGSGRSLQIDHIVPFYLGGSSDLDQLQTLCRVCNAEKAINELNFRISRAMPGRPPKFTPLEIPAKDDLTSDDTWRQHIQRAINFYYKCAATEKVEFLSNPPRCEICLRPGIDVTWIEPHLVNFTAQLTEQRTAAGLTPLGRLRAVAMT
jgi:superfamily II DNA or RNA helicase